jgi:hypothetical protein
MLPFADLQKFTGYYEPAKSRSQSMKFLVELQDGYRVTASNGVLVLRKGITGPARIVVPVAWNQFRQENQQEASMIFFVRSDGRQIMTNGTSIFGERVSPAWPWTRLALILLGLTVMASSVVYAPVWIVRTLLGRMNGAALLWVRIVPLLAVLIFAGVAYSFVICVEKTYGEFNFWTAAVWLGTWLFAFMSVSSLALSVRAFRQEVNRAARLYSLLVSIALCSLSIYLMYWHLIGIRFWAD